MAATGPAHLKSLQAAVDDPEGALPEAAREMAQLYLEQIAALSTEDRRAREEGPRRGGRRTRRRGGLQTMPGVGPVTAMAVAVFAPPMDEFRRGRDFAAWLGLVPRQHSTGGKERLGKVSKIGAAGQFRRLLITGAMAVVRWAARKGAPEGSWLARMLAGTKDRLLVAVRAPRPSGWRAGCGRC